MSNESKAPLNILADEPEGLGQLLNKAQELAKLESAFHQLLTPELAKLCQVANISDQTLIILVNSGTTATQLKFMSDTLCKQFSTIPMLAKYQQLSVKVRPPLAPSQKRQEKPVVRRPACPPSEESLKQIRETAEGIMNEDLRAALLRLGR